MDRAHADQTRSRQSGSCGHLLHCSQDPHGMDWGQENDQSQEKSNVLEDHSSRLAWVSLWASPFEGQHLGSAAA